jgi:hypothetical protein
MVRTYTLTETNRLLPLVQAIASEIVERRSERQQLLRQRETLESAPSPEGLSLAISDLDARILQLEEGIDGACRELLGLQLTVLRTNPLTIHFPGATRSGAIVFCWQEGEDRVSFGHPSGEEEDPRRPLKLRVPDSN